MKNAKNKKSVSKNLEYEADSNLKKIMVYLKPEGLQNHFENDFSKVIQALEHIEEEM